MSVLSCWISVQIIHSEDSVSLKKHSAKKKQIQGLLVAFATRCRRFAAGSWSLSRRKIKKNLWDQGSVNWDWKIFFMLSWMTFVPLLWLD